MANTESTPANLINPLIGLFPDDTLLNCSQVLTFLSMYSIEDCPSEAEKMGLSHIHSIVKRALDYEVERVGELRKGASAS